MTLTAYNQRLVDDFASLRKAELISNTPVLTVDDDTANNVLMEPYNEAICISIPVKNARWICELPASSFTFHDADTILP